LSILLLIFALGAPEAFCAKEDDARDALFRAADQLQAPSPVQRRAAVEQIGKIGPKAKEYDPRICEFIIVLIAEEDVKTKIAVLNTLAAVGPDAEQCKAIAGALNDPNKDVRRAACKTLGKMGESAAPAAEALGKTVSDASLDCAVGAIEALIAIGPAAKAASSSLIEALKHKNPRIRQEAARALARINRNSDETLKHLAKLLPDDVQNVRIFAALAMATYGGKARSQLSKIKDARLKAKNAEELKALDKAIAVIENDEEYTGDQKAKDEKKDGSGKLIETDYSEQVKPLLADLGSTSAIIRTAAAKKIAAIGPGAKEATPETCKKLVECLEDKDVNVRRAAADALLKVQVKDELLAKPIGERIAGDNDVKTRATLCQVLAQMGPTASEASYELSKALTDKNADVVVAVCGALGAIGAQAEARAGRGLLKSLESAEPKIRAAAATAVGKMRMTDDKALPSLCKLLKDASPKVRTAAADAIGEYEEKAKSLVGELEAAKSRETDKDASIAVEKALRRVQGLSIDDLIAPKKK